MRQYLQMGIETIYKEYQIEMCILLLTKTWLGDFLPVARRDLEKSEGQFASPGFPRQFFVTQLLIKEPHRNSTFQKHCN